MFERLATRRHSVVYTLIRSFLKTDGPTLQAKLVDHASTRRNWIEDWWLDVSYLGYREYVHHLSFIP
jgi:hypothetical protein